VAEAISTRDNSVLGFRREEEPLRAPRPGALAPLSSAHGVRKELVDDALAFMDEYDDVFRSLAR
jgi:hypothetical protein